MFTVPSRTEYWFKDESFSTSQQTTGGERTEYMKHSSIDIQERKTHFGRSHCVILAGR